MAKLTDEERATLAKLQARENEPDDEDFDIEIWDGDRGTRVPYSKGKGWLKEFFGFDIGDAPAAADGADGQGDGADPQPGRGPGDVRRFGGRRIS